MFPRVACEAQISDDLITIAVSGFVLEAILSSTLSCAAEEEEQEEEEEEEEEEELRNGCYLAVERRTA